MKSISVVVFSIVLSVCCLAQSNTNPPATPVQLTNIYAAGVSYNNQGSPSIGGTALFAHALTDGSGTYAFTVYDALPVTFKPFNVTSNIGAGFAQRVFSIKNTPVFIPTSAGVSFSGSNTGWQWSTGALVPIKVSKSGWYVFPTVRVAKSSVSGGTGYQPIVGVLFGWGQ